MLAIVKTRLRRLVQVKCSHILVKPRKHFCFRSRIIHTHLSNLSKANWSKSLAIVFL